jgi:hypothetical protein
MPLIMMDAATLACHGRRITSTIGLALPPAGPQSGFTDVSQDVAYAGPASAALPRGRRMTTMSTSSHESDQHALRFHRLMH